MEIDMNNLTPLQKARWELQKARPKGGIAYKQAKAHYLNVLKKEKRNGNRAN